MTWSNPTSMSGVKCSWSRSIEPQLPQVLSGHSVSKPRPVSHHIPPAPCFTLDSLDAFTQTMRRLVTPDHPPPLYLDSKHPIEELHRSKTTVVYSDRTSIGPLESWDCKVTSPSRWFSNSSAAALVVLANPSSTSIAYTSDSWKYKGPASRNAGVYSTVTRMTINRMQFVSFWKIAGIRCLSPQWSVCPIT
ncbi:hypothetical protein C8Q72DRAFT_280945 [Fomitopsis betulina]|nr:hypothetical protein C8Q72DRAFT_280945 [Fomitopsis betulina]